MECAINLTLFCSVVRKSHSNVAPREHSSRYFLVCFPARFPAGGHGARLISSPGRGASVTQILWISRRTATQLRHLWDSDKELTIFWPGKPKNYFNFYIEYIFISPLLIHCSQRQLRLCIHSLPPLFETILGCRRCWL